jgi:hypothetical protein
MTEQERAAVDRKIEAQLMKLEAGRAGLSESTFRVPALTAAALMGGTAALVKLFF